MSTIKSSSEHLTLNADGTGKEIKLQNNGVEKAKVTSTGIDVTGSVTCDGLTSIGSGSATEDTVVQLKTSSNSGGAGMGISFGFNNGTGLTPNGCVIEALATAGTGDKDLIFKTTNANGAASEKMRVLGDGGITFNGDTSASNALDDYEEGTWTPSFSGGGVSINYTTQQGNYTKVGRMVTCHFRIDWTSLSGGSGSVFIEGFPFTIGSASIVAASGGLMSNGVNYGAGISSIAMELVNGSTHSYVIETRESGGSWANTAITDFSNSGGFRGTFTYMV